jgi:hypothetical protein
MMPCQKLQKGDEGYNLRRMLFQTHVHMTFSHCFDVYNSSLCLCQTMYMGMDLKKANLLKNKLNLKEIFILS